MRTSLPRGAFCAVLLAPPFFEQTTPVLQPDLYDEDETLPVAKSLERGRSGYADIAVAPDGTILCLYARGHNPDNLLNPRRLTVARFNLEWLTDGRDSLGR